MAVAHLGDDDGIAHRYRAAGNDLEEDALAREDAVARQVVDSAFLVAHLADLGKLEHNLIADLHLGAERQREQVHPLGGDVLGEVALLHVEAHRARLLDGFPGEQRYLAMPVAGMGVARHTMVRVDMDLPTLNWLFTRALALGDVDGANVTSVFHDGFSPQCEKGRQSVRASSRRGLAAFT